MYESFTRFYDQKGEEIAEDKDSSPYYINVDGVLFAPLNINSNARLRNLDIVPFLARQVNFGDPRGDGIQEGEIRFFRLPALMRAHRMDFKRIFIATDRLMTATPNKFLQEGGEFWLVYELQARVWRYNQQAINKELFDENAKAPFKALELPGYVPPVERVFSTNRPMPKEEYIKEQTAFYKLWSRILWFGKLGGGYGIAYTIPSGYQPKIRLLALDSELTARSQKDIEDGHQVLGSTNHQILTLFPVVAKNSVSFRLDRHSP